MEDNALQELAVEEILKDLKRGAERAKEHGALGWQKNPAPPPNKRFLGNMLVSTLRDNRSHNSQGISELSSLGPDRHQGRSQNRNEVRNNHVRERRSPRNWSSDGRNVSSRTHRRSDHFKRTRDSSSDSSIDSRQDHSKNREKMKRKRQRTESKDSSKNKSVDKKSKHKKSKKSKKHKKSHKKSS